MRVVNVDIHDAIAAYMDEENESQITIFTSKQEVLYVNWKENVAHPVVARQQITPDTVKIHDVFMIDESNYYITGYGSENPDRGNRTLSVYKVDKETAKSSLMFTVPGVYSYAISKNLNHLAAIQKSHVSIYDLKVAVTIIKRHESKEDLNGHHNTSSSSSIQELLDQSRINITYSGALALAVAVSDQGLVAVASAHGPIHLLYPQERDKKDTKEDAGNQRAFKWHFDGATALSFSADQRYLLSGGTEKVLVMWNLELGKTQFLPRLSGAITAINIDPYRHDLYNVMLAPIVPGTGALSEDQSEILVVSAVDLISRLAIAPCRPQMALSVKEYRRRVFRQFKLQRKEAQDEQGSDLESENEDECVSEPKSQKSSGFHDFIRHDISAISAINPKTNHLYLPNGLSIQAFDLVRGEQAFVQHVAPQLDIGRVKSELKIADPQVEKVAFTHNGKWMITFDLMPKQDLDNLLSKNDTAFALKFWAWADDEARWQLSLKIVDPHGPGLAVGAIVALPTADSVATIDSNGGIRLWRPRPAALPNTSKKITTSTRSPDVWTLRRSLSPSALAPAAVAAAWSPDSSLLGVAHGTVTRVYDPQLLEALAFELPRLSAPVEYLSILDTHMVMVLAVLVSLFDLVSGKETALAAKFYDYGAHNLVAADLLRNLFAVAVNLSRPSEGGDFSSRIFIFLPHKLKPIHEISHKRLVVSLTALPSGFVFVDSDTSASIISPVSRELEDQDNIVEKMHSLLVSAQAAANVLHSRSATESKVSRSSETDDSEKWVSHRLMDLPVIEPVFTNVDGIALDTLFERVVRAIQ